ncbi:MAG: hypothetical protein MUO82_10115 [Candidatus Thermoplasmatota archaeon]|nr:hypothetical protein [Candidatus Thermoplasmatota archaeon]
MKRRLEVLIYSQKILLIIAGIAAIIISIADIFGILSIPWIADRIELITLLLVGLFLTGITILFTETTTNIENEIKKLPGVEVMQFEDAADVYNYVTTQLITAEKSVDDITWGSRKGYRTKNEAKAYKKYVDVIEKVCKKDIIKYREISSLSDENYFNRSMHLIEKGYYNYHLGYYDTLKIQLPLMSFIIIDSKKVIVGFYRVPVLSPEGEIYLCITNDNIVRLYIDYFATLWTGSDKIKDTTNINENLISQIKEKLNIK